MVYKERIISKINKELIIKLLRNNEIIISPTDTLYGILTNAFNKDNVEFIYKLKNRDKNKPLLLLTDDFNKVKEYLVVEKWHNFFINKWPGSLTLVFRIKDEYLNELQYLHRGHKSLAIRIPKNDWILNILKNLDFPVVAPSANLQSQKPASNINEIINYFKDYLDRIYIVEDEIKNQLPSTIIELIHFPPKILRKGAYEINFFTFESKGHRNITATHQYTLEFTKDNYLTKKGSCIIAIESVSNKEFKYLAKKANIINKNKIKFHLFTKNHKDEFFSYFLDNENPSNNSLVIRRSYFIDDRTGGIKSSKTAADLSRKLIKDLKNENKLFTIVEKVKLNTIVIDINSIIYNYLDQYWPDKIKNRLTNKKKDSLFDENLLKILKEKKLFQYTKYFIDNIDRNKLNIDLNNILEKTIEKIKEINGENKKDFDITLIILAREFFFSNEEVINKIIDIEMLNSLNLKTTSKIKSIKFFLLNRDNKSKVMDLLKKISYNSIVFSSNLYLLKKLKKLGFSTISNENRYYVDFLIF